MRVECGGGGQRTWIDGADVTDALRAQEVGNAASAVSAWPGVRARMVALQREIAGGMDMVLDGRDIGTRVLPNATLKVFLTADPVERARRRHAELVAKGVAAGALEEVLHDLNVRDAQDVNRAADPLRVAEDAVMLDTTGLTQAQVARRIVALYRSRLCEDGGTPPQTPQAL
jgi:cytidylate kinase